MEAATIVAGLFAIRSYRFPFIVAVIAFALWFLSMDVAPWLYGTAELTWADRRAVSLWFRPVATYIQVTMYRFQSSSDMPLVSASGPSMRSPGGGSLSRPRRLAGARGSLLATMLPGSCPVSGVPSVTSDTSRLDRMQLRT